jgi:hypothetical protein
MRFRSSGTDMTEAQEKIIIIKTGTSSRRKKKEKKKKIRDKK